MLRTASGRSAVAALLMSAAGCSDYLTVNNPNVIAADALDPKRDATTLSLSGRENYSAALGWMTIFTSDFVWESWLAVTPPDFNLFGLRSVVNTSSALNTNLWGNLSVALAGNEKVIQILRGTGDENSNIDLARSLLFSGYSMILMGEDFCQAVITGGPPLTSEQVLDSAIARFTRAASVAQASAGSTPARGSEAFNIVNAALVGIARAELQLGRKSAASADAARVAGAWTYNLTYTDNAAARQRLSNLPYFFTRDLGAIVVPPEWRTGDPRVPYAEPGAVSGFSKVAQDGVTPFYPQTKFSSYDAPLRLASRLEADYIAAEATGSSAMLTLINARRSANAQPAYTGPTDDASVLTEFEEQRGREFYLEGKRLGDFRRNPTAVLHVPRPGQGYFKNGYNAVGSQTCLMLPLSETANNPNFQSP